MKIKFVMFSLLFAALFLTACSFVIPSGNRLTGSGKVITETRTVSGFDGITVNGAGKIFLERTGTETLTITTDDNLLSLITTEVRGGKLVIEFKSGVVTDKVTDLTFRITVKNLNSLDVNGAATVDGKNIDADRLVVTVDGAAAIKLAGKANQLEVTLNGAGAYSSENLECKRAKVTNSGAGSAVVRVSDSLDATISGIGMIEYIGNPQVTKNVSGIGVVRQK